MTKDNLYWEYHVNDLKGWKSAAAGSYNVRYIPASFLIDQNGIIIARNLKPQELDKMLANLINS